MLRFNELENSGARLALFSEVSDGDCRSRDDGSIPPGRLQVCRACGLDPASLASVHQMHGTHIVLAKEPGPLSIDADGLITDSPGLPIIIMIADCAPVYLLDPIRRAIGLLHAGREGTRANIAQKGVSRMSEAFGCDPANMHALVGPSAGPNLYEVSEQLAEDWSESGLPARGRLLNLWEANRLQLIKAGIPSSQVSVAGLCTISDHRFFSHRRDADGRRNMALLML